MPELTRTFIITSVIHFSGKKLKDQATRSVFTPRERITQTIKTVHSIKEKVPGAIIILLEMGKEKNISTDLVKAADKYVFIGDRTWVKWAVNGKYRGLGEAAALIAAKKELFIGTDFFFKMSGRYILNEHFDVALWHNEFFSARKYGEEISTRLYGFNRKFFADWQSALKRSLFKLYCGRSLEEILPLRFGRERIHEMKKIGVSGYTAPNGEYIEE
jgi:hypothetical protein